MAKYYFIYPRATAGDAGEKKQKLVVAKSKRDSLGFQYHNRVEELEEKRGKSISLGEPDMRISNLRGSTSLTVPLTTALYNKLHLGELFFNIPYAERFPFNEGVDPPRVDLADFDFIYGRLRINELKRLRDQEGRGKLINRLLIEEGYFTGQRIRQFSISPDKLDEKIAGYNKIIKIMSETGELTVIYEKASDIERQVPKLTSLIENKIQDTTNTRERKRKTIESDKIIDLTSDIYENLIAVLGFLQREANPNVAKKYWQRAREWTENPNAPIFVGSLPGLRKYIREYHTESKDHKIPDSTFTFSKGFFFQDEDALIREAIKAAKQTQKSQDSCPLVIEREYPISIGYNAVFGEKKPTNNLVIEIGQNPQRGDEYGIKGIYPGRVHPTLGRHKGRGEKDFL